MCMVESSRVRASTFEMRRPRRDTVDSRESHIRGLEQRERAYEGGRYGARWAR